MSKVYEFLLYWLPVWMLWKKEQIDGVQIWMPRFRWTKAQKKEAERIANDNKPDWI